MKTLFLISALFFSISTIAQNNTPPPPPVDNQNSRDTVGIFDKVEVEAAFPGGVEAWKKYLQQNFRVNQVSDSILKGLPAKERNKPTLSFTAIVQFIVCKDGAVCEVRTLNNVPEALKKEAERLITESKQWEPAQQNNRSVKAYRRQPITIFITQE